MCHLSIHKAGIAQRATAESPPGDPYATAVSQKSMRNFLLICSFLKPICQTALGRRIKLCNNIVIWGKLKNDHGSDWGETGQENS